MSNQEKRLEELCDTAQKLTGKPCFLSYGPQKFVSFSIVGNCIFPDTTEIILFYQLLGFIEGLKLRSTP